MCVKVRAELRPRAKADDPASEVRTTKKMLKLLGDKYTQVRHTHSNKSPDSLHKCPDGIQAM